MNIGIDFDDVIADSMQVVIDLHNRMYGTSYTKDEATSFHLEEIWGGTKEEWEAKLAEFLSTDHLAELNPMAGAVTAMGILEFEGHELYVISGRSGKQVGAAEQWIKQRFPDTFAGAHFEHVSHDRNRLSKAARCKELKIDLMIEDDMRSAKDCASAGIHVYLFDQSWNRTDVSENMTRVHSWDEIIHRLAP